MRKKFLLSIFFLASSIAFLHMIGSEFFLYWRFWWYDIVMHFLGGLMVGMIALWVYNYFEYFKNKEINKSLIFLYTFLVVLSVGIGWEVFEFLIEVDFSNNYISDTSLDLIMDIVGSLFSSVVFLKFIRKNNNY